MKPLETMTVQDDLLATCYDLERLQAMLADSSDALLAAFHGALVDVAAARAAAAATPHATLLAAVEARLGGAVKALQFHDLSAQLLGHTRARLESCIDLLAEAATGDEAEPGLLPMPPRRANPVAQAEMDTGSIELF